MNETANGAITVDDAARELAKLRKRIDSTTSKVEAMYERRALLFRTLMAGGWRQASVARAAGVTPMAVSFAVDRLFEREVDPDGALDPKERARRASQSRRDYFETAAPVAT